MDGNPDLAIAHRHGSPNRNDADGVSLLLGDGQGRFEVLPGSPLPAGKAPTSVAIGDFNGDGVGDVAVANFGCGSVSVFLGSSSGFRPANGSPFRVGAGPTSVALADLNEDGRADIVTANLGSDDISIVVASE